MIWFSVLVVWVLGVRNGCILVRVWESCFSYCWVVFSGIDVVKWLSVLLGRWWVLLKINRVFLGLGRIVFLLRVRFVSMRL